MASSRCLGKGWKKYSKHIDYNVSHRVFPSTINTLATQEYTEAEIRSTPLDLIGTDKLDLQKFVQICFGIYHVQFQWFLPLCYSSSEKSKLCLNIHPSSFIRWQLLFAFWYFTLLFEFSQVIFLQTAGFSLVFCLYMYLWTFCYHCFPFLWHFQSCLFLGWRDQNCHQCSKTDVLEI